MGAAPWLLFDMTPTPTDVGTYRNTLHAVGGEARSAAPLPIKGKQQPGLERDDTSSVSSHGGGGGGVPSRPGSTEPPHRGRPPPITTSLQQQQQSGGGGGGGPGNMPSGISVQELKQMTALRMAHEQAHHRTSSPFASGEPPLDRAPVCCSARLSLPPPLLKRT